jgi:ABC-2 type transport system permease protein
LLGSAVFSTLSLVIACIVKSHERIMGMGQVMTMPLFFASNAIYPIVLMPAWLKSVAAVNPLTYEVDGLRALMVQGGTSTFGLGMDFAVLVASVAVLVAVATRLYPRLIT